jgi:hypothetical protein
LRRKYVSFRKNIPLVLAIHSFMTQLEIYDVEEKDLKNWENKHMPEEFGRMGEISTK